MTLKTTAFDPARCLDTPEAVQAYLADAFESGDAGEIADAIGVVARARGMSDLAREAGLSRTTLYRALSREGRPELPTLLKVLDVLGLRLTAVPTTPAG